MIERDLVTLAEAYSGETGFIRDHLALRWRDGAILVWSGPPGDPGSELLRELLPPAPWGSK